jgi:hypothetical protein
VVTPTQSKTPRSLSRPGDSRDCATLAIPDTRQCLTGRYLPGDIWEPSRRRVTVVASGICDAVGAYFPEGATTGSSSVASFEVVLRLRKVKFAARKSEGLKFGRA